jgi:glyoxylase-like metal-dependent hydrolase (beta-lactamase superfamily II)
MIAASEASSLLQWELFIRRRPSATQGTPPGKDELKWVANTVTLIYGEHDALLVDTFLSEAQTAELADWIASSGKRLSRIYITHAHADHFFGLKLLRDRFPHARAITLPQVADAMRVALTPEAVETWRRRFPGLIPSELVSAERLEGGTFDLEGHQIIPVDIGHTDTDHTTCLHVPSIGLVIAGDAIYNGTHPYLVESDHHGLLNWLAAIDKIEALKPSAVVVGHGPPIPTTRRVTSPRRGAISTTSYVSPRRRRPPANSTTVCSPFIPTVSIRDRFGAVPTPRNPRRGPSHDTPTSPFPKSFRIREACPHAHDRPQPINGRVNFINASSEQGVKDV